MGLGTIVHSWTQTKGKRRGIFLYYVFLFLIGLGLVLALNLVGFIFELFGLNLGLFFQAF